MNIFLKIHSIFYHLQFPHITHVNSICMCHTYFHTDPCVQQHFPDFLVFSVERGLNLATSIATSQMSCNHFGNNFFFLFEGYGNILMFLPGQNLIYKWHWTGPALEAISHLSYTNAQWLFWNS